MITASLVQGTVQRSANHRWIYWTAGCQRPAVERALRLTGKPVRSLQSALQVLSCLPEEKPEISRLP